MKTRGTAKTRGLGKPLDTNCSNPCHRYNWDKMCPRLCDGLIRAKAHHHGRRGPGHFRKMPAAWMPADMMHASARDLLLHAQPPVRLDVHPPAIETNANMHARSEGILNCGLHCLLCEQGCCNLNSFRECAEIAHRGNMLHNGACSQTIHKRRERHTNNNKQTITQHRHPICTGDALDVMQILPRAMLQYVPE